MTVAVVSEGTEGPSVNFFFDVDEVFINGESVRRPQAANILVVAS